MQRSPEFTGSVGARYTTDVAGGRLALSGNLYYSSKPYFDPAEQLSQGSYATLGLRAEWTAPSERYTHAVAGAGPPRWTGRG
jgi:iron complex outermembrane receptor protein